MSTTTNFADFGWRERKLAAELLTASCEQGFPKDFDDNEVTIMFNQDSGCVFFTNADYQVCMMNGDKLESFYTTPYEGREGFAEDLKTDFMNDGKSWDIVDVEYLYGLDIISEDEFEEFTKEEDETAEEDE